MQCLSLHAPSLRPLLFSPDRYFCRLVVLQAHCSADVLVCRHVVLQACWSAGLLNFSKICSVTKSVMKQVQCCGTGSCHSVGMCGMFYSSNMQHGCKLHLSGQVGMLSMTNNNTFSDLSMQHSATGHRSKTALQYRGQFTGSGT